MGLPKIDLPIMEIELPSSGEKVKYRPFTVREEKILLVGQSSDDPTQEMLAAKQVVNNCLLDKDVSELAMFDLEYILLILRARSVNNLIEFKIKDPDTNEPVDLSLDIDQVSLKRFDGHTNEIAINDVYTLFLKYPTIDEFVKIASLDEDDPLADYFMLCTCIDYVASEDEVYYFKDYNQEEINTFMDDLSGESIKAIQKFFETMPRLRHEIPYTNKEGKEQTFVIEGLRSFFI
jgi:hypothetical protein